MLSSTAALQRPGGSLPSRARSVRRPVRCFQDGPVEGGTPAKATVRFSIPQQTRFGEHVAVVGSFSGWDTQAPVQLEWSEGSVWSGEAELPAGQRLEYKYVVVSDRSGQVTWQPGGNLVLELGPGGGQKVLVLDDWLGRTHEVCPAPAAPAAEPAPADAAGAPATTPLESATEPEAALEATAADAAAPELPAAAAVLEQPSEAAQRDQPLVLEQPAAAASLEPEEAAAGEAVDQQDGNGASAVVPAEAPTAEPGLQPAQESEPEEAAAGAEEPAAAVLAAAEQPAESNSAPAEKEHTPVPARTAEPAPVRPTAADSWHSVLAAANQPVAAPYAAEPATPASENGRISAAMTEKPAVAAAEGALASQESEAAAAAAPAAAAEVPEPAAAVGESRAAASWRSVLEVANQPYMPPQPAAAATTVKQPEQEEQAARAEEAEEANGAAATTTLAAPVAAAEPAAVAAEAAALPAAQPTNGSKPAGVRVAEKPTHAAPKAAAPARLPATASSARQRGASKGVAPWLRLLLAAAVVLSAILFFMKSPWAAVRWALSAF